MLCLSRKANEIVVIYVDGVERLRLHPYQINEGSVRLAFTADQGVTILRAEVAEERDGH